MVKFIPAHVETGNPKTGFPFKKIIPFLVLIFLGLSLSVAYILVKQSQETRRQAVPKEKTVICFGEKGDIYYGLLMLHKYPTVDQCQDCNNDECISRQVGDLVTCGKTAECIDLGSCRVDASGSCSFTATLPPCSIGQLDCLNKKYEPDSPGTIIFGTKVSNCTGPCSEETTPTPTFTPTPTNTLTPSPTPTGTLSPTPTNTLTPTPTNTLTPSPTPTGTLTPTNTPTNTPTPTPTNTPTNTPTPIPGCWGTCQSDDSTCTNGLTCQRYQDQNYCLSDSCPPADQDSQCRCPAPTSPPPTAAPTREELPAAGFEIPTQLITISGAILTLLGLFLLL